MYSCASTEAREKLSYLIKRIQTYDEAFAVTQYGSTKAVMISPTEYARLRLAADGVDVSTVEPEPIWRALTEAGAPEVAE